MHSTNKDIIHLANLIGRTPNSISLRLVNFTSVDPILKARGIKGIDRGAKLSSPSGMNSSITKKNKYS